MAKDVVQRIKIESRDNSKRAFKSAGRNMDKLKASAGKLVPALAAVAGVTAMGAMIKNAFAAGDNIGKMADRLNASTKGLAAMQHAAQLAGVELEGFDKGLERMTRSIGDASTGLSSTVKRAFQEINIEMKDLEGLKADEQFELIAKGVSGLGTQAEKAAVSAQIFGRSGIKMLNLMEGVAQNIDRAKIEVEKFGLALTRADAKKMEDVNDSVHRLQQASKGLVTQFALALAPELNKLAELATEAVVAIREPLGQLRIFFYNAMEYYNKAKEALIGLGIVAREDTLSTMTLKQAKAKLAYEDALKKVNQAETDEDRIYAVELAGELLTTYQSTTNELAGMREAARKANEEMLKLGENKDIKPPAITQTQEEEKKDGTPDDTWAKERIRQTRGLKHWQEYWAKRNEITAQGNLEAFQLGNEMDAQAAENLANKNLMLEEQAQIHEDRMREIKMLSRELGIEDELTSHEALMERMAMEHAEITEMQRMQEEEIRNNAFMSEEQKQAQLQAIRERAANARLKLDKLTAQAEKKITIDSMKSALGSLAQHSKAAFNIHKALGISDALISTYKGAAKALELPFPLNWAQFGAVIGTGLAQVASIKSTSFGGGGGASSSSASSGASATPSTLPTSPASVGGGAGAGLTDDRERRIINISPGGTGVSPEFISSIVKQYSEAIGDRAELDVRIT